MPTARHQELSGEDYRVPANRLPPAHAPRWMSGGLVATGVAFVLVLGGALFGPMDEAVSVSGVVRPTQQRLLHSATAAAVAQVHVRPGERVEAGALLVTLDPWEVDKELQRLDQELVQARAELRLAEATRAKIEVVPVPTEFLFSPLEEKRQREIASIRRETSERLSKLHDLGGASIMDLLNQRLLLIDAETALRRSEEAERLFSGPYGAAARQEAAERVAAAQARIAKLETDQRLARVERERHELRAPVAGRVMSVSSREPGERVAAGAPLVRLALGEEQELRLYASEDRLNFIAPGQLVRFQPKRQADKLARPAVAEVTEVALDRDLADEAAPGETTAAGGPRLESYRITARVVSTNEPLPASAEVDAEIVIRRHPFWRHMLTKLQAKP